VSVVDWKSAQDSEIVCYCRNVDKGKILKAIRNGASTLKEVMERTGAGKGGDCAVKHPRKLCCHMDIKRILDLYVGKEENRESGCG
jgi:NAD(P)H-nitrite reductase large subunit